MGFLTMCDIFKAAATAGNEELNDAADRKAARKKPISTVKRGGMGFLTMCDIFKAAATAGIEELNDAADRKAARKKPISTVKRGEWAS